MNSNYVTKKELQVELNKATAEMLNEVRIIINEQSLQIKDMFSLLYNEIQDVKLIQTQHTRHIDEHTKQITDLERDVGQLQARVA